MSKKSTPKGALIVHYALCIMHFELTNHLGSSAAAVGVLGNNDVHALEWTVAYHAGNVHILHALNLWILYHLVNAHD